MTDRTPIATIVTAPRRVADVDRLLTEFSTTTYIAAISRAELDALLAANTTRFFYSGEDLVGFGAWSAITDGWVEIGPFIAFEAYRGQGFGRLISETMFGLVESTNVYGVTKNPTMRRLFARYGFAEVGFLGLPRPVQRYILRRITLRKLVSYARTLSLDPVIHFIRRAQPPGPA